MEDVAETTRGGAHELTGPAASRVTGITVREVLELPALTGARVLGGDDNLKAIGARAAEVLRMMVAGGVRLALPGLVIGGLGAFAVGRLLGSMLLGISPADPLTFATVAIILMAAVALASWIPARRAAAVDPIQALRSE